MEGEEVRGVCLHGRESWDAIISGIFIWFWFGF